MPLERLSRWDLHFFLRCQAWAVQRPWVRAARRVSRSGDGPPYAVVGLLCLLSDSPAGLLFGWHLLLAFAVEVPLYIALKQSCRRPRPAADIPDFESSIHPADRFSFPSGHTAAAFLFMTLVTLHAGWLGLLLLPWAVAVGASRVVLGVHYPGDILAGALVGISVALTVFHW